MLLPTPAVARRAARDGPGRGLRRGLVRRGRAARPARRRAAPRAGVRAGGRAHPRARGRLGRAARRPRGCCAGSARGVDVVTYLGEYTRVRLAGALGRGAALRPAAARRGHDDVPPGRRRRPRSAPGYGLADRPVVVCVSRLVPRKGQDTLIRACRRSRAGCPTRRCWSSAAARTGRGWRRLAAAARASTGTSCSPASVPWAELPAHYAAGRRLRDAVPDPARAGWTSEGLGIVYLEASATGLPVVAGDSGGAPDAVRRGRDRLRGAAAGS